MIMDADDFDGVFPENKIFKHLWRLGHSCAMSADGATIPHPCLVPMLVLRLRVLLTSLVVLPISF